MESISTASEAPDIQLSNIKSRFQPTVQVQLVEDVDKDFVFPIIREPVWERWNHPKVNIWRIATAHFAFFTMGMGDAAPGALIQSFEDYYHYNYAGISLIFLGPAIGYLLSGFLSATVHSHLGQRGIGMLGASLHIISFSTICMHPPWPVLPLVCVLIGLSNGLFEASYCAWISTFPKAGVLQNWMLAPWSIGATIAPFLVTTMISKGLPWYSYYYIMVALACMELAVLTTAFWSKTAQHYREHNLGVAVCEGHGGDAKRLKEALTRREPWLCAVYSFVHCGVQISLGSWAVTFMIKVRHASKYNAGIVVTGYWAGTTIGRLLLGYVTDFFGERASVLPYLVLGIAFELLFWLVPNTSVSAVSLALLGVVFGPLYPAVINLQSKLLPKHLHVTGISFASACGMSGGGVWPFVIGAVAAKSGIHVLQPIVLSLLATMWALWLALPRVRMEQ